MYGVILGQQRGRWLEHEIVMDLCSEENDGSKFHSALLQYYYKTSGAVSDWNHDANNDDISISVHICVCVCNVCEDITWDPLDIFMPTGQVEEAWMWQKIELLLDISSRYATVRQLRKCVENFELNKGEVQRKKTPINAAFFRSVSHTKVWLLCTKTNLYEITKAFE